MKNELTPRQIVRELNKYIVGQSGAKRAVAIALRNRWRRQQVEDDLREEIMPNNIILNLSMQQRCGSSERNLGLLGIREERVKEPLIYTNGH